MNDQLVAQVEELGLSNKEARVYVACLMLGAQPVQKIADFAGIKRVTTYVILEALLNLGLVSQTSKAKKTYFNAEAPENLRRLLDKKSQELAEQSSHFEAILPELKSLEGLPTDTPSVKFYDNAEGIKGLFQTFYTTHKDEIDIVYGISNLDQLHNFFPELRQANTNPERVKHGIKSRFLYTSERGPIYRDSDKESNRQSLFVPTDQFPLNGEINIVGDYVIILSLSGARPLGVTIHSEEVAKGMRAVFELAWEAAKKYNS